MADQISWKIRVGTVCFSKWWKSSMCRRLMPPSESASGESRRGERLISRGIGTDVGVVGAEGEEEGVERPLE